MKKKQRFIIFQEPTGLWHWCDAKLPYLDAQGVGYPTKRQAGEAAKRTMTEENVRLSGRQ